MPLARFWIVLMLAATGLLGTLRGLTEDPAPEVALAVLDPGVMLAEDRALRRATERRQRRISASSGYQIETGSVLISHLTTASTAEGVRTDTAPVVPVPIALAIEPPTISVAVVRATAALTAKQPVPKRIKATRTAARHDAESGADAGVDVISSVVPTSPTVVALPVTASALADELSGRPPRRVRLSPRKTGMTQRHAVDARKLRLERRVVRTESIWVRAQRDGS
jgi:hypothetical protein